LAGSPQESAPVAHDILVMGQATQAEAIRPLSRKVVWAVADVPQPSWKLACWPIFFSEIR
jgi:hypothetical protein